MTYSFWSKCPKCEQLTANEGVGIYVFCGECQGLKGIDFREAAKEALIVSEEVMPSEATEKVS